jgi:hypothetical protein
MYYQDDDFAVADRLSEVAQQRGVSNMKVALRRFSVQQTTSSGGWVGGARIKAVGRGNQAT